MSRFIFLLCILSAMIAGQVGLGTPQSEIALSSLSNPVYPRLALQARIRGDVVLKLAVRRDGTVELAEAVSGPGMLIQAALNSAKNSKFDCSGCVETLTLYQLTYSFQFGPATTCASPGSAEEYVKLPGYPQVTQSKNQVTVIEQPMGELCNGDSFKLRKVRSAKCLYLWKCGLTFQQ